MFVAAGRAAQHGQHSEARPAQVIDTTALRGLLSP
jgi:hypothetical protein